MISLNRTPLVKYKGPGNGWSNIWFKDETNQVSGAFKIRGVLNYFNTHKPSSPVVTASTGNHGTAVAIIARDFGMPAYIFVPSHIAEKKKERLKDAGANVIEYEGSYDECEAHARQYAAVNGYVFIHSFDDSTIIEGHRSIFNEIEQDMPGIPWMFVPVGGGGLLTAAMRHYPRGRHISGVEFSEAPALQQSLLSGKRISVELTPNPVEGLCVAQIGTQVFNTSMKKHPEIYLTDIEQIKDAVRLAWVHNGIKCEMAGAAAFAAALQNPIEGGDCICILSGGNIDDELFNSIIHT